MWRCGLSHRALPPWGTHDINRFETQERLQVLRGAMDENLQHLISNNLRVAACVGAERFGNCQIDSHQHFQLVLKRLFQLELKRVLRMLLNRTFFRD